MIRIILFLAVLALTNNTSAQSTYHFHCWIPPPLPGYLSMCHEGEAIISAERCCTSDEGRPLGIANQGEISNRPELHW